MADRPGGALLADVEALFAVGAAGGLADSVLLDRFAGRPEGPEGQGAFAALVDRHGPMVLRVCRGFLGDADDADDAFQAVFLILARSAGSIRKKASLASWLFGVARRVALRARASRARRERTERRGAAMGETHASRPAGPDPDLAPEVQEEVARLPERYRSVVVLHYLEGRSHEQVAGALGLPVGTVKVRLSRARDRLRDRLARRGLAPSAVAAALAASRPARAPAAPLIEATVRAASALAAGRAAGVSPAVASLLRGSIQAMFIAKLRNLTVLVAAGLAVLLGSIGALDARTTTREPSPPAPRQDPAAPKGAGRVAVVAARTEMIPRHTVQVGNLVAPRSVEIRPRVAGAVGELGAGLGDAVEQGQVLARLVAPEVQAERDRAMALLGQAKVKVQSAEAAIQAAEATRRSAQAQVKAAQATLEGARTQVKYREVALERVEQLARAASVNQSAVGEAEGSLDTARTAAATADAELAVAQANLDEAEAARAAARSALEEVLAGVRIAEADVQKADAAVDRLTLKAPFDGVVTPLAASVGEVVRPEDAGPPLLTIAQSDVVTVVVGVRGDGIAYLDKGDPARVEVQGATYEGKVSRTAYALDPTTGALRAEIDLPNPEGKLRPGQSGRTTVVLDPEGERRLVVPASAVLLYQDGDTEAAPEVAALMRGGSGNYCYVAEDGRAVPRAVRVTTFADKAIVSEGLRAGDRVIVRPEGIRPGREVDVEEAGGR
jgi:RNA polymerase sigma-70 factor (ECF subfamily)